MTTDTLQSLAERWEKQADELEERASELDGYWTVSELLARAEELSRVARELRALLSS